MLLSLPKATKAEVYKWLGGFTSVSCAKNNFNDDNHNDGKEMTFILTHVYMRKM